MGRQFPCMFAMLVCSIVPLAADQKSDAPISTLIDVQSSDMRTQPSGSNWLSYNGDYTGRRFSALHQIDQSNVIQLRAQWVFHVRQADDMEVTPVVVNGVMFVTAQNDAYALDARDRKSVV